MNTAWVQAQWQMGAAGGRGGAGHPDPEITVGGPAGKNFLGAFGSHFGLIISATEAVSRLRDLSLLALRLHFLWLGPFGAQ